MTRATQMKRCLQWTMVALLAGCAAPMTQRTGLERIEHIVVMMQENRSYDHYFGRLRRKSGPPRDSSNPDPTGGDPR